MRKLVLHILLLVSLLGMASSPAQAQSVDALKKQRKEIEGRIKETDKLLKQTQKDEKSSINKLSVLKKHLRERRSLISNYNAEIEVLDRNINSLTAQKQKLEEELEKLKEDYTRLIRKSQSNRSSYSKMMFLLSAKNFDQSLRRVRYLQKFSEYKKNQVKQIEQVQEQIKLKTDSLDKSKLAKMEALKAKQVEAAKLQKDEKSEKVFLAGLQKEEKKLLEQYRSHQRRKEQIDRRLQQAIEEEVRKAEERRKAEEARRKKEADARAAKKTTSQTTQSKPASQTEPAKQVTQTYESVSKATREEQLLTGGFVANRGRLPWPVDKGIISGRHGKHPHPVHRHVEVVNKGTFFSSPPGTNARAVFDGEVTTVFDISGSGRVVIVSHGNYRTIYANLSQVFVRTGQKVSAKQPLGKIYTDSETGQAKLQFQIYKEKTLLNPEGWITR
ncbi:MAG TPA: peptidoglycan DD-metalloendopeptidase family protein [Bacteroidales bacterium]|nr:peptidoglycan DD-metalloendopeptidase family protein [Bacteroidales bacterium]